MNLVQQKMQIENQQNILQICVHFANNSEKRNLYLILKFYLIYLVSCIYLVYIYILYIIYPKSS